MASDTTKEFGYAARYAPNLSPDEQYKELLDRILREGQTAHSGMDEESRQVLGHVMRFNMSHGFPMITERDLMASMWTDPVDHIPNLGERPFQYSAKQGLAEIIGFINGARTVDQLAEYGNKWWGLWATPEKCGKRGLEPGDLGPGSYGPAFHDFPMSDGRTFNQFAAVIAQIQSRPELRTHSISPLIPPYIMRIPGVQQRVVVVPCHGDLRFDVDTESGEMSLVHKQRSADVPVGLPFNMIHYAAILHMMAKVTGYRPKELVYMIDNAHIYKRHHEQVQRILERDPRPFPRLKINNQINGFFEYRVDDFRVQGYDAHPPIDMGGTPV